MAGRTTSQVHQTIVDLVALARTTLGAPGSGVQVWDGPDVSDGSSRAGTVWIGIDDPVSGNNAATAATGDQEWAVLGNQARDEHFVINGAALAWSGDENGLPGFDNAGNAVPDVFAVVRGLAFGWVAQLETAVRNDPSIGWTSQPGKPLRVVGMQVTTVTPYVDDQGQSAVLVGFQFSGFCRI